MAKSKKPSLTRDQFDAASRAHFTLFLRRVMASVSPGVQYVHNWHIDAIAEYLAASARGQVRRLIINMPPRMLKSTLISVAWPAWLLGHNPAERIMAASYARGLSLKHSTDCRAVLEAPWYGSVFKSTRLARDQNEKEKFATTLRGFRRAVSVGGAAIGEGGNILIIDDPISPLQACHRHQREAVNNWFDHTWASRLDDKATGSMVVVMQRLHDEDLSGYLLARGGWEHLCLPAIAPAPQIIRIGTLAKARKAGEALHPAREDVALLQQIRSDMGGANFAAQYQQAPLKQVGALFRREWFVRFEGGAGSVAPSPLAGEGWDEGGANRVGIHLRAPLPNPPREGEGATEPAGMIVQSWDTGIKAGQQHDASACATFEVVGGVHRLIDMTVVRMEYPALKRLMVAHAARFAPQAILVEDKGNGQSLLQDLRRETDLPLIACLPKVDKYTRALRITPMLEAGWVALPKYAHWLAELEEELFSFPDAPHDDQVDAIVQYLIWATSRTREVNLRRV